MFRIEDTYTRSCAICGCPIPSIASKRYCTSCSVTVKSTSMRNRYHKKKEEAIKRGVTKISETHYRTMAPVFLRYGYELPTWEEYKAKEAEKKA